MVAITVVLAAVLYVMVSGFTHSPGTAQSAGLTETSNAANNYTVTVASVSASNIPITNLKVVISGGSLTSSVSFALSGGNWVTHSGVAVEYVQVGSGNYLSAGDVINIGVTVTNGATSISGVTVTLYNGNSQLGSTTL